MHQDAHNSHAFVFVVAQSIHTSSISTSPALGVTVGAGAYPSCLGTVTIPLREKIYI